uniref:NYN domain-containing protein n=1 Tax=Oryza punctata TaxID=4537 RepID=A0A0E0KE63_ORYPU
MGDCAAAAAKAKTSVWWDIDRCGVPPSCRDPHRVAHSVIAALAAAGCTGPVSIFAYGDAARVAPPVLAALSSTGISLNHVPAGAKDGTDKKMLVDMLFWAFDNPPPGNYLLISGDQDFSDLLHRLRMKRYGILLAQPSNVSSRVLAAAAKTVWSWERLVAGESLLVESTHTHSVPDYNPKLNSLDVSKCSQNKSLDGSKCLQSKSLDGSKCSNSKVHAVCGNGDSNVKACNQYKVKHLQKYVKKTNAASRFTSNQDQVVLVDGFSDDFAGSTGSEQDKSSVSSSSSSSESLEVDLPTLLGTPLAESSAQEPVVSTSSQQVGPLKKFIIGEKPSTSAKFVPRKGTVDLGVSKHHHQMFMQSQSSEAKSKLHSNIAEKNATKGNQSKSNPIQRYVKKTNIASSPASNQLDSDGMPECSTGNTANKLDQLPVLSPPNSESLEETKVDHSSSLDIFTLSQSSSLAPVLSTHLHQVKAPHELIVGKKPSCTSTGLVSRDGTNDCRVSIGHYHSTFMQSQSSLAQHMLHCNYNMGDDVGKTKETNQHKVTPRQQYIKKTNMVSSSARNEIDLVKGFSGNSKGSISSNPRKSMLSSSNSESLEEAKVNCSTPLKNPPFSLSSVHKPVTPTDLQHVGSEFIFGNNPSLSTECIPKDGIFYFGATNGHNCPACQQAHSSLLPEIHKSVPPSAAGHSNSVNSDVGSSYPASPGFNDVPSAQIQTSPSGLTFQNLLDICSDFSRLTISECPPGTGEKKAPFQGIPSNYTAFSMPNTSGHPRGPHEIGSTFHPGSVISLHLSHSSARQSARSPSCNMQNTGNHEEMEGSPPSSSEPKVTIRNILHALHILKAEKIFPTESNIADCIHYSEMNISGFDVKKALELAIRHQAVIMKKLVKGMPLFVAKDESIWKCVNVTNSNAKHPKETLDAVHKYISSTDGWSAIKNSQSRYQAAIILKKSCLQQHALGDVLQILQIVIVRKKWLLPHHSSGWQPVSINTTAVDATAVAVGGARS